jgi:hypothetical protein
MAMQQATDAQKLETQRQTGQIAVDTAKKKAAAVPKKKAKT